MYTQNGVGITIDQILVLCLKCTSKCLTSLSWNISKYICLTTQLIDISYLQKLITLLDLSIVSSSCDSAQTLGHLKVQ